MNTNAISIVGKVAACLLFISLLTSCGRKRPGEGLEFMQKTAEIEGSMTEVQDERSVKPFKSLFVYDAALVSIEIGPICGIRVEGPECYVEAVKTEIDDDNLTVKFENKDTQYRQTRVCITAPSLDDIVINGCSSLQIFGKANKSEKMYVELNSVDAANISSALRSSEITMKLYDTRKIKCNFDCNSLDFVSSGCKIGTLSGRADNMNFHSDNTNQIDRNGLKTKKMIEV